MPTATLQQTTGQPAMVQLIKSASDIGSAVAHRLKRAGLRPVLWESPAPGATRRLMSFAGAVHSGQAELEGVRAERCESAEAAWAAAGSPGMIPLWAAEFGLLPTGDAPLPVAVCVDARMKKKEAPEVQIGQAPLVIGIGPGFQAGLHCHAVIESNWGPRLGQVLWEGTAESYTGLPRLIGGYGKERYIYAPVEGEFHSTCELLQPVRVGDVVAHIVSSAGRVPLVAQIGGILRGLAYSGLAVRQGAKLVEIEPTGDAAACQGIAERPARIAQGVLDAIGQAAGR